LALVAADLHVTTGRIYRNERSHYVDMVISKGQEHVVIELKRGQNRALIDQGVQQLALYMQAAKTDKGILFLYSGRSTDYSVENQKAVGLSVEIRVLRPKAPG
jgi:PD-(D/E)XK nuclease superfamily